MARLASELILTLRDRVSGPARGVGRSLDRLTRDARGFNATQSAMVAGVGNGIRNLALLGAGYLGVGVGIGGAVRSAMDFETSMANVAKTSGLGGAQLAALGDTFTDLSNRMPVTRRELAAIATIGATLSVPNDDLDEFALVSARAGEAFGMTAEETANGLGVMMSAFRRDTSELARLTDQINYTADRIGGSERDLIDFLGRTGPTATSFGISPETLMSYGGNLMALGISAERASTGVNAVMVKMSDLTGNDEAVRVLDAFGGRGTSERLQRQFYERPVEAMNELFRLSRQMSAEQRSGFFLEFFGLEYGDDANAIVAQFDKIMEAQRDLADETKYLGGVQGAYDIFSATTANRLRVLGNNLTNIGAAMGANFLGPIVTLSDKLVQTLGTLDERVTVFHTLGAGVRGFFDGLNDSLGLEEGTMGRFLDEGWRAIFGDPATLEEDTHRLTKVFQTMQDWGAWLGKGAKSLASLADSSAQFLGAEPGQAAELLKAIAVGGLALAGVGAVLTVTGRGFGVLARGLFALSGASTLLGGVRGIRNLLGALAGASALGAAAGALGGTGNTRPGATPPRGRLGALGAVLGGLVAVPLTRAMWTGEGSQVDPEIGRQVGEDTVARIDAERAAREADNAMTRRALGLRAASLTALRQNADRSRQGIEALGIEADRTEGAASELGRTLSDVGAMTIAPQFDFTNLQAARTAARALRADLDALLIPPRAVGPGTAEPGYVGARASGGPVWPGTWLVGERGPELVSFQNRGHVLDAYNTRALMEGRAGASGGPVAQPVTINLGGLTVHGTSPQDAEAFAMRIVGVVSRELARQAGVQERSSLGAVGL